MLLHELFLGAASICPLVAVCGLLAAVVSLVEEYRSIVAVPGLGCSVARGIFPDQKPSPRLLPSWQVES